MLSSVKCFKSHDTPKLPKFGGRHRIGLRGHGQKESAAVWAAQDDLTSLAALLSQMV